MLLEWEIIDTLLFLWYANIRRMGILIWLTKEKMKMPMRERLKPKRKLRFVDTKILDKYSNEPSEDDKIAIAT